jgi:TldD protein
MTDPLNIANDILLSPSGLQLTDIDELMGRLAGNKIDYADIYFQHSRQEGWSLEDGKVKSGSRSTDQGVGLRAVSGEKTGFAYSDALNFSALEKAAEAARSISNHGGGISQIPFEARTVSGAVFDR